jgi:hypothetical protein
VEEKDEEGLKNVLGMVCGCFMFIIFISAVAGMGGFEHAPGWWVGGLVVMGLVMVGAFLFQVIKGPADKQKALDIQKKARDAFQNKEANSTHVPLKSTPKPLNCRFCGAPIQIGDNHCKYCGQSWIWDTKDKNTS